MYKVIIGVLLTFLIVPVAHADSTLCSCVRFAASIVRGVPLVDAIFFPTFGTRTYPAVGRVAMFKYGAGVLESHVAVVTELEDAGFWVEEGNWRHCQKTTRFIQWDEPSLVGFLAFGESAM